MRDNAAKRVTVRYDGPQIGHQYRALKKLLKLLETADGQLVKGYNHKALGTLDEALGAMQGLHLSSSSFRARVLVKMCSANSAVKRHEVGTRALSFGQR